ncbi:hypothetical protein D3C87_86260 [compost metagenome]
MIEYLKIEKILNLVKSKSDAHNEFKREYDKQLAFDFSLFNFFDVGENKVSQILAYFLDEKQNHGQGNAFLNEFLSHFYNKEITGLDSLNICERVISNNRRIDIYIELPDITIAIENKIWADDQYNQLHDYAKYLEYKTNGKFLLLYLTPYGLDPTNKSIGEEYKQILIANEQLKIISYKQDILNLIDRWLVICKADNVSFFIKEFRKFLEVKFLGNNTLNMSKNLREIIFQNQAEVQSLVAEYKIIENEIIQKLNETGKTLDKEIPNLNSDLELSKSGLFNWYGTRVYKYSISKGGNKIWIQYVKNEINLFSNYYFQDGTDEKFKELVEASEINKNKIIDHTKSVRELVKLFLEQVEMTNEIFEKHDLHVFQNESSAELT